MSNRKMKKEVVDGVELTWGSDNIFADLKRPNPEEHLLKSELVSQLRLAIESKGLKNQSEAAAFLGIPQPHLSRLLRGRFEGFSVERLMNLLIAMGKEVEIVVRDRPRDREAGAVHVLAV
ncbi:MAG TPA: helix-turn-helix transcriptional regulator [Oscillatoriaceae cyanobacterium]